ncbi:MAG: MotA/TolQ/ExbB proton channel family protein [candidate division KSB1 bacterium]|nr:MotA/TolQ/ExbB proton channel family protein [candidate division KSB1 bacterium]
MQTVWEFLVKGGITMIPLGLCSLVGLAIVIEKLITLRRSRILIPEVVAVVDGLANPDDVPLVLSVCQKHNGPLPNIVRTALENRHLPREEMKELILDQGRQEIRSLERGLVALETVAAICPLLGLFGTVIGILKVFNVISRMGVGQATALSGGISEALITTIVGLAIAIPAVVAYNYLSSRAENLVLDIEKHTTALMRKISLFQLNSI